MRSRRSWRERDSFVGALPTNLTTRNLGYAYNQISARLFILKSSKVTALTP